jgi:hypothetical protein
VQAIDNGNNAAGTPAANKINLRKFGIGNGALYNQDRLNDILSVQYLSNHAMMDSSLWTSLVQSCCAGSFDGACITGIFNKTIPATQTCYDAILAGIQASNDALTANNRQVINLYNYVANCIKGSTSDPGCYNFRSLVAYVNSTAVKTALHVNSDSLSFDFCSAKVITTYNKDQMEVVSILKNLAPKYQLLLYYADLDAMVPFTIADAALIHMNYPTTVFPMIVNKAINMENAAMPDGVKQVLGWETRYSTGSNTPYITYTVVRGSGHVVPTDKPYDALQLLADFAGVPMPAGVSPVIQTPAPTVAAISDSDSRYSGLIISTSVLGATTFVLLIFSIYQWKFRYVSSNANNFENIKNNVNDNEKINVELA